MFKRAFLVLAAAAAVCATNTNPREHYEKLFFEAMTKLGFKILRFTNGEVIAGLDAVIQKVQFECRYRTSVSKKTIPKPAKKLVKRKMVIPLPRVVYEEPFVEYSRTRASKVRTRKVLDKSKGEVARIYCAICKQPIANSDLRVRHRKGQTDEVFWVHKSCTN